MKFPLKIYGYLLVGLVLILSACANPPATQINTCYWQVGEQIEYRRKWYDPQFKKDHLTKIELPNADTASFHVLENPYSTKCYAKDDKQVYTNQSVIEGADPETFTFIGGFYARDKKQVFHLNKMLPDANVETFKVFDFFSIEKGFMNTVADAKDDQMVYNRGRKKSFSSKVDVATFTPINSYYFKDKDHVYRGYDPGKPVDENVFIIEEASPDSFEIIDYGEGCYARDATHIYLNAYHNKFHVLVPEDLSSFEVLNVRYSKDNKKVYYYGEVLEGADAATFDKEGDNWGIDKNGKWTPKGELENK